MKKFVLHDDTDNGEARTEALHEFLRDFDWEGNNGGIEIDQKEILQVTPGDTIVVDGDQVSVLKQMRSYPYLHVSRSYDVSYGVVLEFADRLDNASGHLFPVEPWQVATTAAWENEGRRQLAVLSS